MMPALCNTINPCKTELAIVLTVYSGIPLPYLFYSISNRLPPVHNSIKVTITLFPLFLNTTPP